MHYLERFHDMGSSYVIVDGSAAGGPRSPSEPSFERVSPSEARWVLERVLRSEPHLVTRLFEALSGAQPFDVDGGFRHSGRREGRR